MCVSIYLFCASSVYILLSWVTTFNICAIVLKVDVISLQFAGGLWVVHWCYMLLMGICWHKPTEKTLHHCLAGVWDYVLHQISIALFVTNELHIHYCITLGHLRRILFENIAAYLVLKIILRTCLELQTALGTVKWMTHADKEHYHAYTLTKKHYPVYMFCCCLFVFKIMYKVCTKWYYSNCRDGNSKFPDYREWTKLQVTVVLECSSQLR